MLDLFAELTGLTAEIRELRLTHLRIAEALERLSPPLASGHYDSVPSNTGSKRAGAPEADGETGPVFHVAESPEEYQIRMDREASLADSLGVAPWSPELQKVIMEVRAEMMLPRSVQDEEGNWSAAPPLTEAEAEEAIRQGFILAKAEANRR
jgi:hypothetical protein